MSHTDSFKNLPYLTPLRRKLRKQQTKAEYLLWQHLRNRSLFPFRIRRQFSIANYIVDFYCHSCNLIIEIDGDDHAQRYQDDLKRQKQLENFGYTVVRYRNQQVYDDVEAVIHDILRICTCIQG